MKCSAVGIILGFMSLLSGCGGTIFPLERHDGLQPFKPENSIVVGRVSEGFLTQPHGLYVYIRSVENKFGDKRAGITPATLQLSNNMMPYDDVDAHPNRLANLFIYEVPPGVYTVERWTYHYYAGASLPSPARLEFTVQPGEVAYIGDLHGVALTMCLSNRDNYAETVAKLKAYFPILQNASIANKAGELKVKGWPHDRSTAFSGKALCEF